MAIFKTHPDLNEEEFLAFANRIYEEDDPIMRNITVLEGTIIKYVFPLDINESAKGIDLMEIPDQRQSVMKAILADDIVLTDPVELVQGGYGLVGRMPIKIMQGEKETLWGLVSIVF